MKRKKFTNTGQIKPFITIAFLAIFFLQGVVSHAQIINTIAGSSNGYSGDGGPAVNATLHMVGSGGVACDANGNIYIADVYNQCIRKVDASGNITTVAGTGTAGYNGDNIQATSAELYLYDGDDFIGGAGVACDASGNLYITDFGNNRIRKVDASGMITTIAGTGVQGYAGDSSLAINAQLYHPMTIAIDAFGNIYFGDQGYALNDIVRKIDVTGTITTYAGDVSNSGPYSFNDAGYNCACETGPATTAGFGRIGGIAVDNTGNLYISDKYWSFVCKVDITGMLTQYYLNVSQPTGMVCDPSGNVYIVDQYNNRIVKINASNTIMNVVAGNGTAGFSGDGGPAIAAELNTEFGGSGIALDPSGNLYVADGVYTSSRIRKIGFACDTVVAGTITASVSGCLSSGDTLSLNGSTLPLTDTTATGFTGINYQWQSSTDGITWANVGGDSTKYIAGALATTTYYRNIVSCAVSGLKDTTQTLDTLTPFVTPTVSIVSSSGNTICSGTNVVFNAVPINGGANPAYQWAKNGTAITGATDNTYADNALNNNDAISCTLTSNAACTIINTAASDTITMVVTTGVTPTVSISTAPGDTICSGTSVTFAAAPNGAGSNPSFSWEKNNVAISGATGTTYTDAGLSNNDVIVCVLTSDATCATQPTGSDTVTMTVNPNIAPTISISATPGDTICQGATVTFTATTTNEGTNPSYQWTKNNQNIPGATSATYTTSDAALSDVFACTLTSNATCVVPATISSNNVTMFVNSNLTPTVSVTADPNDTICAGTSMTFTAAETYGGTTPLYSWTVNGTPVAGATDATYSSSALNNNDTVICILTSNATCVTAAVANSNENVITVNPIVIPTVSVSAAPGDTICAGVSVTFTAATTNAGATPVHHWMKNGSVVSNNSTTYSDNGLVNNDVIIYMLISDAVCPSADTVTDTNTMTVNAIVVPAVSITADPGTNVSAGTSVTFTATATNGGSSPAYQWQDNGVNITGATTNAYTSNTLTDNSKITCILTSDAPCADPDSAVSNADTMHISSGIASITNNNSNIRLYPNPNNGMFTVEGTVSYGEEAQIEVLNIIGQVVYTAKVPIQNGLLNTKVALPAESANSVYLLHIKTDSGNSIIRFVMER